MKKLIPLLLLLVLFSGCSGVPYSTKDKIAFSTFVGSQFVDGWTTRQCIQNGGRELNLLLPSNPTDKELVLFKLADTGIVYLLGEIWLEQRQTFYYVGSFFRFGISFNNYRESR